VNFFNKIFGKIIHNDASKKEEASIYVPKEKIPIDELFTVNFKKNGGKFLYCETNEEVLVMLGRILKENNWDQSPLITLDKSMSDFCEKNGYSTTEKVSENGVFFTSCEHLIAQNGSILVNDLQFKEYKLHHLPELIIVFSKTSQLLESIQDGLKQIKKNYTHNIPGNITAIKNFKKENESQKDFLSYGSSNKDLYLILLENL
jgi:hypothetical protein|tara:strand:- start:2561 stop:3169 length:609 start_codon:yes stop_codon:yes gene_type:complete